MTWSVLFSLTSFECSITLKQNQITTEVSVNEIVLTVYVPHVMCQHLTVSEYTSGGTLRHARGETIMHVANVQKQAALRLFYDAKWETNCRVAGRNGSWPRLSLINSVRCAPLIKAACHWHAPLPQRADDHAPDLGAAAGRPQAAHTHTHGHTHADPSAHSDERSLCTNSLIVRRLTIKIQFEFPLLLSLLTEQKRILFSAPRVFSVTRRKPENAHDSTKISISIILNRSSIPPHPTHTNTNTLRALVCKLYQCNWCNDWK